MGRGWTYPQLHSITIWSPLLFSLYQMGTYTSRKLFVDSVSFTTGNCTKVITAHTCMVSPLTCIHKLDPYFFLMPWCVNPPHDYKSHRDLYQVYKSHTLHLNVQCGMVWYTTIAVLEIQPVCCVLCACIYKNSNTELPWDCCQVFVVVFYLGRGRGGGGGLVDCSSKGVQLAIDLRVHTGWFTEVVVNYW